MDSKKTTVLVDEETEVRIKLSAKDDRRGWTNQLVHLAREALDARDRKASKK